MLSRYGTCHVAANGEEAVSAFRMARAGTPYNLISMDIRMPGMDGIETARLIRAIETEEGVLSSDRARIIMQTVDDRKDTVQSGRESCDSYLLKPISAAKLISELRKMTLIA
jgi:CheY-like chemotaxis protein